MSVARGKIVQKVKIGIFHLDEDRISYPKDKGSPLLKRLAPRRPPLNPAPPEEAPPEPKQAYKDE